MAETPEHVQPCLSRLNAALEAWLRKKGFRQTRLIELCRLLIWVAGIAVVLGTGLLPWVSWPFWLGLGVTLSVWNFYNLAFFLQNMFPENGMNSALKRALVMGQLFRSAIRLFITGFLIYAALTLGAANPIALVVGLSTTVIMAPAVLLRGLQGHEKF